MRILIFLSVWICCSSTFAQTFSKADSLERIIPQLSGTERAIALYDLCLIYSRSDHSKLGHVIEESKKLETDKDKLVRIYALLTLAIGNTTSGNNDSALHRLKQAKEYAGETKNPMALIRVCGTLGRFLIGEGKAEEGLKNLFEALKLLESVGFKKDGNTLLGPDGQPFKFVVGTPSARIISRSNP